MRRSKPHQSSPNTRFDAVRSPISLHITAVLFEGTAVFSKGGMVRGLVPRDGRNFRNFDSKP
jgi:hypothetical protein